MAKFINRARDAKRAKRRTATKTKNHTRITNRRKHTNAAKTEKSIRTTAPKHRLDISANSRHDPVAFLTRQLGEDPWKKQQEILRALRDHRLVTVRSCNASGKTYAAALAAIWWLMAHDEAIVITTAPSERQVKETLWREIRTIHNRNKNLIGGKITATRLELSNQRWAYGFSTNTAERFQGFHNENILIIVDEASGVREFIFDAILGSMTSKNARMLMIGNPTSLAGTFYDSFHKNRNQWKTIHISAFETPNFETPQPSTRDRDAAKLANDHHETPCIPGLATPVWADEVRQQHGERSSAYQVRVLGEFPDEADDTLIPLKLIEAAVNREVQQNEHHEPDMGLDVARFGNDQTVAIVRYGPRVAQLTAFRKADLMQTTGRALEIARSHNVKTIHVDEVGMGAAVVDRIAELNKNKEITDVSAIGVNGGKKADNPERCFNLRTQMFEGLKQRFFDGDISIPDDPELISQLAAITYSFNSRMQLQIQSKQQIRDSGRQSPDKADALALAFTAPTNKTQREFKMWILSREGIKGPPARRRRRRYTDY